MHPLTQRIIARSPARLRGPMTAALKTADGAITNRLPGLAAEIAFWVLLSLPSLLLTAIAAASLVIEGQAWEAQLIDRAVEVSSVALTSATIESVVVDTLEQLLEGGGPGLVSFAFLVSVWTASRAVRVVLTTIAIVSSRGEQRRGWEDRLLGFGVTLATLVVGAILAPLLVAGPNFGDQLVSWLGTDLEVISDIWRRAYWPTVVLVATLALTVLYHLGIPGHTRWRSHWPGAVAATAVWLAGSGGLRVYGAWIADGDSVYGPLAGPIVLLLWLWLTGFAVLLGAQLNAQVERLRLAPQQHGSTTVHTGSSAATERQAVPGIPDTPSTAPAGPAPTVALESEPTHSDHSQALGADGSRDTEQRSSSHEPSDHPEASRARRS